jgi:hypothetical protein
MYRSVNDRIQVQTQNSIQSDIPFCQEKWNFIREHECRNCFHFSSNYSVRIQMPELSELFSNLERENKKSKSSNLESKILNVEFPLGPGTWGVEVSLRSENGLEFSDDMNRI